MAKEEEDLWKENMLALRQVQANLSRIVPERMGDRTQLEQIADQVKHMIMIVKRLFEQLKETTEKT